MTKNIKYGSNLKDQDPTNSNKKMKNSYYQNKNIGIVFTKMILRNRR